MKKNIFLSRALFLVSFVAIMPLLSMDTPKKSSSDDEPPMPFESFALISNPTPPIAIPDSMIPLARQAPMTSPTIPSLEQSMITPKPERRGFGIFRSAQDLVWNEEENLLSDLTTKKFDVNNSSYHRKLDTTVEAFVKKENSKRLADTLAVCRKDYHGKVKIGDIPARMSHEFLVAKNQEKQSELRKALEEKDKLFIAQQNLLLAALQKSFKEQVLTLVFNLATHLEQRGEEVKKGGTEIRILKEALLNLHKLNKTFKLPQDGYCSDGEVLDKEDIISFYGDHHILHKIDIDQAMNDTKRKTELVLAQLQSINASVQNILPLRY